MLDPIKYKTKRYLHFDHRVKIGTVESYVTNPQKMMKHSFLPFIHYVNSFYKNTGKKNSEIQNRPIKKKNRDIMYAGHLDNYIYKYYADSLNDAYNIWTENHKIDECSTAYRNHKNGKSNIDFAAEIINTIISFEQAYILVGDFSHFFDKIDHKILKKNLLTVLNQPKLYSDWFNVYKSITKYGYYEKAFLSNLFGTDKEMKKSKRTSYFDTLMEFRKFQKENPTQKNENKFGIPQGTAISAVFANVYAIEFDLAIKKMADRYLGFYRRYSDDFILVIPKKQGQKEVSINDFKKLEIEVRNLAKENKIIIQEEKTGLYSYSHSTITNITLQKSHHLDYLGFIFDGKTVRMRGKSPYKFYRKAYQLIDKAKKVKANQNMNYLPYRKRIYSLYTDLGIKKGEFGNFITYAKRAQEKFDQISPHTENLMLQQIKKRKKKIEDKLGMRIHTKI